MNCMRCTRKDTGSVTIWTNSGSCGNADNYVASCSANICTCPNGTPTVADGFAGTLCDTATEDCSQCSAGHSLSSIPVAGSAQRCLPNKPCTSMQVENSDQSATGSIAGTLIILKQYPLKSTN